MSRDNLRRSPAPTWFQNSTTLRSSGAPGTNGPRAAAGLRDAVGVAGAMPRRFRSAVDVSGGCRLAGGVGPTRVVAAAVFRAAPSCCGFSTTGATRTGGGVAGVPASQTAWVLVAISWEWAPQVGHRVAAA